MDSQIKEIIQFLLNMQNVKYFDEKQLIIEINDNNKFNDGNVKIDATGSWIKTFCIQKFKSTVWNNINKKISVRFGEKDVYQIYRIDDVILLELEEKPYLNECHYYVSFVFNIPVRTLRNTFPVIKKYIKSIAEQRTDIKIKLTGSEQFWKEDDKINKCSRLIGECIANIMIYDLSNDFRNNVDNFLGVSNKEAVIDEINKIISNQLLQSKVDEFND